MTTPLRLCRICRVVIWIGSTSRCAILFLCTTVGWFTRCVLKLLKAYSLIRIAPPTTKVCPRIPFKYRCGRGLNSKLYSQWPLRLGPQSPLIGFGTGQKNKRDEDLHQFKVVVLAKYSSVQQIYTYMTIFVTNIHPRYD